MLCNSLYIFSLPPSRQCYRNGLAEVFNASSFVNQETCDQDQAYFIGHTGKCFRVFFIVKSRVFDHNMSCVLDINNNGGIK